LASALTHACIFAYNARVKSIQKKRRQIQYTIRAVPPEVDQSLRRRARREGRSLNDVALEALAKSVGLAGEPERHHDLDELIGTWVPDPEFDAAMEYFERIDEDMWR
jgi:plasmid stability protein